VLKSTAVARFKLHRGLTVTRSEIGNKNIPLSVSSKTKKPMYSLKTKLKNEEKKKQR